MLTHRFMWITLCLAGHKILTGRRAAFMNADDYSKTRYIPRPSHADYTAEIKYLGYQDYRGGGHFSGRITAPLVAAGAIFLQMLKAKGIEVGTHVAQMQELTDAPFADEEAELRAQLLGLEDQYLACLSDSTRTAIQQRIEQAQAQPLPPAKPAVPPSTVPACPGCSLPDGRANTCRRAHRA